MERSCFSEKTLTLSVLTAEFALCVLQTGAPVTARSFLLRGLPMTLALVLITALTAGAEQRADSFWGTDLRSRVVCGGLGLWFVWEAVETFRQAQELCWGNFSSMAMLGLLPLLLWAGWKLEPAVLVRCAPILCWAAALAGQLTHHLHQHAEPEHCRCQPDQQHKGIKPGDAAQPARPQKLDAGQGLPRPKHQFRAERKAASQYKSFHRKPDSAPHLLCRAEQR